MSLLYVLGALVMADDGFNVFAVILGGFVQLDLCQERMESLRFMVVQRLWGFARVENRWKIGCESWWHTGGGRGTEVVVVFSTSRIALRKIDICYGFLFCFCISYLFFSIIITFALGRPRCVVCRTLRSKIHSDFLEFHHERGDLHRGGFSPFLLQTRGRHAPPS